MNQVGIETADRIRVRTEIPGGLACIGACCARSGGGRDGESRKLVREEGIRAQLLWSRVIGAAWRIAVSPEDHGRQGVVMLLRFRAAGHEPFSGRHTNANRFTHVDDMCRVLIAATPTSGSGIFSAIGDTLSAFACSVRTYVRSHARSLSICVTIGQEITCNHESRRVVSGVRTPLWGGVTHRSHRWSCDLR
jgi:hypothetical protein